MFNRKPTLWTIICAFVLIISVTLSAKNVSVVNQKSDIGFEILNNNQNNLEASSAAYIGSIKIHMIELKSRWMDNVNVKYDHAHLDYGLQTEMNIPDGTTWESSFTWNGANVGFGDVSSDNIGAVAAVFNGADVLSDAYPPNGYWYNANYSDASATATPGNFGRNETAEGFTHSVFIEEGTATW